VGFGGAEAPGGGEGTGGGWRRDFFTVMIEPPSPYPLRVEAIQVVRNSRSPLGHSGLAISEDDFRRSRMVRSVPCV
jgi:hypothetical protein